MRSTTKRHRRLTVGCALITAVALGGVYAGQSTAAGSPSPLKDDDSTSTSASTTWERQDEASREFTECVRDNGLKDFPDIVIHTADDGRGVRVRIDAGERAKRPDPVSKEFRKAVKACRHILKDIGVDLPVPPDGPPGKGDRPSPPDCGGREEHKNEQGNKNEKSDESELGSDAGQSAAGLVLTGTA
ncbi:hypothetical protein [Streptomyces sp. NBC_00878]|uniref:hypothetical protein n=1 Tax=Streptomyces sp. NBC_00878 TaxID=2975854 RepID=UPI00225C2873|nr:hypothetical protein [Streptomyces sp. NBC_00878]MCX4905067.1 hypothetical protein [Streptomyces sp. NBC_00878]